MQNFNNPDGQVVQSAAVTRVEVRPLLRLTYMWMGLGLLLTAFVSYITYSSETMLALALTPGVLIGSLIGSLVLVIALSWGINRLSPTVAGMMFFVYAGVLGFVFSVLFLAYGEGRVATAFVTTGVMFGVITAFAFTTPLDLTKYGTYFMMALVGLIVAIVLNMFLNSGPLDYLISVAGVLIFTALTAYDTQKIAKMAQDPELQQHNDTLVKLSIVGALTLYLDFINLFLFILRLMGGRD